MNNVATFQVENRVKGFLRIQVLREDGSVKTDTGFFPNLVTNQGLDWLGNMYFTTPTIYNKTDVCPYIFVGTGSTAPADTDTQLTAWLGYIRNDNYTSYDYPTSSTYVPGPPAYWSSIFTFSGAQGAIVGNIAELGVGSTTTTGGGPPISSTSLLFSHALIVDGGGNPTTISVTATDSLIITYELRMYLDLTDHTYSITIGGVAYSGTYRMASVTTVPHYSYEVDIGGGLKSPSAGMVFAVGTGTIVPVTGTPTVTNIISNNTGSAFSRIGTYTPGSYTMSWTGNAGPNQKTFPTQNISVLMFTSGFGNWQYSVSPAIPYQNYQKLTVTFSVSWARYP